MWWIIWGGSSFVVTFVFLLSIYSLNYFSCVASSGLIQVWYADEYMLVDSLGCMMVFLTLSLWVSIYLIGVRGILVFVSVFSGVVVYFSNNVFVFWFFYELSILSTLYLLIYESPYSERYSAGWYFGGYIIISSLPMLSCIILLGYLQGSYNLVLWHYYCNDYLFLTFVVCLLFCMKIPIPPFHGWLPLVHAEASSSVSVILSGYIMKLGVIGVFRFGCLFTESLYLSFVLLVLLYIGVSFLVGCYWECDAKRWLALLSLAHILIVLILCGGGGFGGFLGILYCVGHGLSAGSMFILVWWAYRFVGSRSWSLVSIVCGCSLFIQCLSGFTFFGVCGFPITLQFVCEVWAFVILFEGNEYLYLLLLCVYVFCGSLIGFLVYGLSLCEMGVSGGGWFFGYYNMLYVVFFLNFLGLFIVFVV